MTPTEFNVIPDIRANLRRLEDTLSLLGSDAPPAFLGAFVDSKPGETDDAAVLEGVRRDVENGVPAIMGNQEFNAILSHLEDEHGAFRARSGENRKQHASFIHQFGEATPSDLEWVEWFLALPLWLDLRDVRLVHGFWRDDLIESIRIRRPDAGLRPEDRREIAVESKPFARAVKLLLTGPKVRLPNGYAFRDNAGTNVNLSGSLGGACARSLREAAFSVATPERLPEGPVSIPPDVFFS